MSSGSGPLPRVELQRARAVEGDSLGRSVVEAVPGSLRVRVERHRLQQRDRVLSCTTYVSDGLRAAGQREVSFTTLDEREGEGPQQPVLALFAHLLQSARNGQRLEAGDVTQFEGPGFPWGQGELSGLVYTHALPLPEVAPPEPPALTAIALTAEELEAVRAFGASRVLARLAMFHRYFPCPPWADRRRKTFVSKNAMQPSLLSDQPELLLLRGSVALAGAWLRIRLDAREAGRLRSLFAGLATTSPPSAAMLLQPDPEADACLAWKSTQQGPEGLAAGAAGGQRISGGFLVLEPRSGGVRIVEDGFAVSLGIAGWKVLRESLASLRFAESPAAPVRWSLDWIADALPPLASTSPERTGTTLPASGPLAFSGASVLRQKTLLCPEELAARAVKRERLADYLKTVEHAVLSHFSGELRQAAELQLEIELPPSLKVVVRASAQPPLPADLIEDLKARLSAIPSPLVREAGLALRLDFAIQGGALGEAAGPAAAPQAAAEASGPLAPSASADYVGGQLAEAEMLVEYGMVDKAMERLGAVLASNPGHAGVRAAIARIRGRDVQASGETLDRQPASPPPRRARETCFAEGDLVDQRFRVMRFIAKGGMGEVYEAADEELGERVALKTILPEIARDLTSLARFKREISLARRIAHPNVCRIFEFGLHREAEAEDTAFLTMELLLGDNLAHRIEKGRLSPRQALPIVAQMSAALGAAHRAGVVHRDFKSSNVMLIGGGEAAQRAVVTDFGLARQGNTSASLTDTGMVVGTPAYMAPEQVEGGEVTPASDIYALGIVMFEMITGALPFEASTPMAVAVQRLRQAPPRPRKLVPDLDPTWEAVILLCLERDPARRFGNAEAVAKELGA